MQAWILGVTLLIGLPTVPDRPQAIPPENPIRVGWKELDAFEEEVIQQLVDHLDQIGDSRALLWAQFERIQRKEHLDLAALRVEQILNRVKNLNSTLLAIERAYAQLPEPTGSSKELCKQQLAEKRGRLADLTDAKNGAITRNREVLRRLIQALENDPSPSLQLARDAEECLRNLERSVNGYVNLIDSIVCYRLIELIAVIEREQRMNSILLHQKLIDRRPSSRELLRPK
jgi:hypothetical protein